MTRHRRRVRTLPQRLELGGRIVLVAGAILVLAWAGATGMGRDLGAAAAAGVLGLAAGAALLAAAWVVRARRRNRDRHALHRHHAERSLSER